MNRSRLATAAIVLIATSLPAVAQTIYSTSFDTLDGWTVTAGCTPGYEWAADATPAVVCSGTHPYVSAPASLNFNNGIDIGGPAPCPCGAGPGSAAVTCGEVTSPVIDLSGTGRPELCFSALQDHELSTAWDMLRVRVEPASGGTPFLDEHLLDSMSSRCFWRIYEVPLDAAWGKVRVTFRFDTLDGWVNDGAGPFIDDLSVVETCSAAWTVQCRALPKANGSVGATLRVTARGIKATRSSAKRVHPLEQAADPWLGQARPPQVGQVRPLQLGQARPLVST